MYELYDAACGVKIDRVVSNVGEQVIIRFDGLLVEVQLHLGIVLDLKALSHAAYNVVRADCSCLQKLRNQNLVAYPYNDEDRREQGVDGVRVNFLTFVALPETKSTGSVERFFI